jgi:ABC-2 type transport system permease protein
MTVVQVTWLREVRAFRGAFSCCVPVAAFLAASGWSFVMLLRRHEGGVMQVQSLWGLAVAPWLPILSAVLTMRLFSEERSTGMIDLLMASPIRERDLVIGKYLSAMTVLAGALALALIPPAVVLPALSSAVQGTVRPAAFAATYLILLLQSSAWCAAGTMVSVFFRNQAAAAVSSLILCSGLPVALYAAVLAWVPSVRMEVAWMPLLMHVFDVSTGLFSTAVLSLYLVLTVFFLFGCSKLLACLRLRG